MNLVYIMFVAILWMIIPLCTYFMKKVTQDSFITKVYAIYASIIGILFTLLVISQSLS